MKTSKLKEAVENVSTFGEALELLSVFYTAKNHNFHMSRQPDGWLCKVMKVTKVVNGKDVRYTENFILKEQGSTFEEAFQNAARAYLK